MLSGAELPWAVAVLVTPLAFDVGLGHRVAAGAGLGRPGRERADGQLTWATWLSETLMPETVVEPVLVTL